MDRPRLIAIGSDVVLQVTFFNVETNQPIEGATGTATITNDDTGAVLDTITLTDKDEGLYEAIVPYNLAGLTEGLRLLITFFLDGGAGLRHTKSMKAVARTKTDDGL